MGKNNIDLDILPFTRQDEKVWVNIISWIKTKCNDSITIFFRTQSSNQERSQ